jgi:4-aminobutyrate aminotransferase/(S)-3-amino-2-methylpropionate transaminase
LAGGFPLSAVIGWADVMDAPAPGGLGGTYAGNPVACAAALAVLDIFEREDLLRRARWLGLLVENRFRAWLQRYPIIGDVRVTGAMAGLELVRDRTTREPATAETALLIAQCREQGLLLLKAGAENNVIRTLMPLNIPEDLLETGLATLEAGIAHVSG